MDLPPPEPAPRRGSRARLVGTLLLAIGLPMLLLAGCTTLVVTVIAITLKPQPGIGFIIGDGYCEVDPATGNALVQLPVTTAQTWTQDFTLQPLGTTDLILVGVASLAEADTLQTLDDKSREYLRQDLDNRDDWARADDEPTNVVLEFRRDSRDSEIKLGVIELWWASGEPAFVQEVNLDLTWSESECSVDT